MSRFWSGQIWSPYMTATFGSGVKITDASEFLKERGKAFIHVPSYEEFKIIIHIIISGVIRGVVDQYGYYPYNIVKLSALALPSTWFGEVGYTVVQQSVVSLGLEHMALPSAILPPFAMMDAWTESDIVLANGTVYRIADRPTISSRECISEIITSFSQFPPRACTQDISRGENCSIAARTDFQGKAPDLQNRVLLKGPMSIFGGSRVQVVINTGKHTSDTSPGDARWTLFPEMEKLDASRERDAVEGLHRSRNIAGFNALQKYTMLSLHKKVDNKTLENPAVGPGYKLMSATCEECGWSYRDDSPTWLENSVACPLYEMHRIVFRIKLILLEIPAGLSKILIRFQPSSKTLLSFANRIADTVIFEISYSGRNNRNEAVAGLGFFQGVMQTLIREHLCRPHGEKNGLYYNTEPLLWTPIFTGDPVTTWPQLARDVYTYDPLGVFRNKFALRFLGVSKKILTPKLDIVPSLTIAFARKTLIVESVKGVTANCQV
ncbi:Urease accessory protein UreD 2 [Folsomia candida]|uniref:Urease accessory protein UreD 2 n=1 Tax=Folsomia candida TaxID=158441 RepID=A0A226DMK8_FOLCA|nr:Urease accessory protein UreD 2 [Folsomia candida]